MTHALGWIKECAIVFNGCPFHGNGSEADGTLSRSIKKILELYLSGVEAHSKDTGCILPACDPCLIPRIAES